ncbi:hypothetical protein NVV94_13705 [Pseudomonas sp. LS1212]|uniref:hypothetical protein n=1 Tax=Pseudomonas sp. LS1212 TaxID=2972478 RepID=UPI00215D1F96|nr:hypothetical protein [Pseudomonas sp. LS1212]UVJ41770.1 hypothetical protein NVV94_13705 [Pseudomonas sp. LS1212]
MVELPFLLLEFSVPGISNGTRLEQLGIGQLDSAHYRCRCPRYIEIVNAGVGILINAEE